MIRRIELVMKSQNLTSSQFADKLGVQRSGLSHILSGRNKPSLDFVLKVLAGFPDLNPQWLLQGKGKMYANMAEAKPPLVEAVPADREAFLFPAHDIEPEPVAVEPAPEEMNDIEEEPDFDTDTAPDTEVSVKKNIARIVLFYTDGTFSEFQPDNKRA